MVSTACSVALTAVDVLLGDRGKRQASEGFETVDLREAEALLQELALQSDILRAG